MGILLIRFPEFSEIVLLKDKDIWVHVKVFPYVCGKEHFENVLQYCTAECYFCIENNIYFYGSVFIIDNKFPV